MAEINRKMALTEDEQMVINMATKGATLEEVQIYLEGRSVDDDVIVGD
jgi:hypothetical protein